MGFLTSCAIPKGMSLAMWVMAAAHVESRIE